MAEYIVDGKDKILGRVASRIAKLLLDGNKVIVLNAGEMVISGHPADIYSKYKQRVEFQDKANPEHSPYWSRRPDLFVKRVIRGMLPFQNPRGKMLYKQLHVYIGVPENLKDKKTFDIKSKEPSELYENTMTVRELSKKLGYNR